MYHSFASAYGWTIDQVDAITYPQLKKLSEQMVKFPPTNLLLKGLADGLTKNNSKLEEQPKNKDIDKKLKNLGDMVQVDKTSLLKKKFGETVKKIIVKKTGKRII